MGLYSGWEMKKKVTVTVCGELVPHTAVLAHVSGICITDPHSGGLSYWQETSNSVQRSRTATHPLCDLGKLSKRYLLSLVCKTKGLYWMIFETPSRSDTSMTNFTWPIIRIPRMAGTQKKGEWLHIN